MPVLYADVGAPNRWRASGTVGARISSKRVGVAGVQSGQRRRGGRRDRVEDAEQRVAVALAVAADQLRVVEVVAGVEAHAVGQPAAQLDLAPGVEQRDLDAVDLRRRARR